MSVPSIATSSKREDPLTMITQVEFTLPFKVDSSLGSREEGREFEKTYDETVTPQIWERMDSIMGQLQDSQGSSRVALGKYNIEVRSH